MNDPNDSPGMLPTNAEWEQATGKPCPLAHPVGKPYFYDLEAVQQSLDWLMTASMIEADIFLSGDRGAVWANRIRMVLQYVASQQGGVPCLPVPDKDADLKTVWKNRYVQSLDKEDSFD